MESIYQFFADFIRIVADGVIQAWDFINNFFSGLALSFLSGVVDLLPDLRSFWSFCEVVRPYSAFINNIVPLDTISTLVDAYFLFLSAFITFKITVYLLYVL